MATKRERVACDVAGCDATFTEVGAMRKHVRSAHEGVRVVCDVAGCDATFTQVGAMQKHIRRKHNEFL